jgi:hypothetical protein
MALSPLDYILWTTGFVLEAYVVVYSVLRRDFLRYSCLNFYLIGVALTSVGEFFVYRKFGFDSVVYSDFYYYTDSLLILILYFAIMQLYQKAFSETQVGRYVRSAALLLLGVTSLFSYLVVQQQVDHLTSRFIVELSQNLYFVGVVLTYLLWGAILKLRETRIRLVQLVLALGVFFSAHAAAYAFRNLFPGLQLSILKWIPPIAGLWLPAAWAYTFTKVPEDARLMTSRLLARAR